jgi:poly(3-hydroxybutyrate) depolymerase
MLHGCGQTPIDSASGTGWNQLADRHSFVVAYPQQTMPENVQVCWNWFMPESQQRGKAEAGIIAGITQQILTSDTRWTIDRHRIVSIR